MQRFIAGSLSFLFCMAPLAHAASGTVVPDLSPARGVLEDLLGEQDRQDADAAFDASSELFPSESGASSSSAPSEFLVIRVGIVDVTLRDVPLREWFAPYVRDIAELHLVSGYRDASGTLTGLFGPADPVTLEQMVKVVVLAAGIDDASCPLPPHNLTSSGSWSASYVSCAEQREWAVFSDASVDVHRPATREEVVMTILQAFKQNFDVDPSTLSFTDVEKTSAFAPAIAKAAADGVVSGYNDAHGNPTGLFGPTKNVTRAEFSKIVSVALQLYKK